MTKCGVRLGSTACNARCTLSVFAPRVCDIRKKESRSDAINFGRALGGNAVYNATQRGLALCGRRDLFKAIVIAALTIPALVLTFFVVAGLFALAFELISRGRYSERWLGLWYAGAVYSCVAVLIAGIPTVVVGLPAALMAQRHDCLTKGSVIFGAAILGGASLCAIAALFFNNITVQTFLWFLLVGASGGVLNGFVFWRNIQASRKRECETRRDRQSG